MTTVEIRVDVPGPNGRVPGRGTLAFTPTRRRVAADGAVVLPNSFRVNTSGGVALVELDATGLDWVWKIEELFPGLNQRTSYVTVPESAETVQYADLVAVDPATLVPEAVPEAAWWAAAAANVQDGAVVGDELVLTRKDGSTFNAGNVRGPAGPPTTDASLLDSGTLPEGRLPARLGEGELSATYGRPVFKLESFGPVDTTGAAHSNAAWQGALTAALAVGGTIELPSGTVRVDAQTTIPIEPGGVQKSIRITGQGRVTNWQNNGGNGGTILDLRFPGNAFGAAKIESYGQGVLEIDHLTLADDGSANNAPFVRVIGTLLHAHDLAVTGNPSKLRRTCDQDAFILGGLQGTTTNDGPDQAFQGYGSVVERVVFEKIRTGVMLRRFANSVVISDLSFSNRCGSNTEQGAIEIDPGTGAAVPGGEPAAFAYGNIIRDCLIEVMGYIYGVRLLNKSEHNIIRGCSFWDADTNTEYLGDIYLANTATANIIRDTGVQTQNKALVDVSGQNYWFGPMFGPTGYVNTMVGGNQGLAMRGSIKARYTDSFQVLASDGTTVQTAVNQNGVELKNDGAYRAKDNTGTVRALVSLTASNQIMLGDVLTGLSNQSVIINAAATSFIRARVGGVDQIQVSNTGLGFFGKGPTAKPSLTYSKTGESAAEAQLRTALVALGLVTDSTTA